MAVISKPGSPIPLMEVDNSHFGGFYEIFGLRRDLEALGYTVHEHSNEPQIVFEFNSEIRTTNRPCRNEKTPMAVCVTDLSLLGSLSCRNATTCLSQVPHWQTYYPFQTYVLDYIDWNEPEFDEWQARPARIVYGGGSRSGIRQKRHMQYLHNNRDLDAVFTSALELSDGSAVYPKIPHSKLLREYRGSRFGLVIGDPHYERLGMLTQRPYEYMACGMIPIFDRRYNSHAVLGSDAMVVSDRDELARAMRTIENSPTLYAQLRHSIARALRSPLHRSIRKATLNRLHARYGGVVTSNKCKE